MNNLRLRYAQTPVVPIGEEKRAEIGSVLFTDEKLHAHRVSFAAAEQIERITLEKAPPGARINPISGEINWQAPATTHVGRPIEFKVRAEMKGGYHIPGGLQVFKLPPSGKL